MDEKISIGLDIGTTTISAVVVDTQNGSLLARKTVKSDADMPSENPLEKTQDASRIEKKVREILEEFLAEFPVAGSIGITGQMHGVVYLDGKGQLLSPLYTWQDRRAEPYCEILRERTGYAVAPGYGLATHYALAQKGEVPAVAAKLCTIMDYLAYALTGSLKLHSTNAASLGFFSGREFDIAALKSVQIDPGILPEVTNDCVTVGKYAGVPVAVAIGDNQASFLGSVANSESMALANFGTGSQISMRTEKICESGCVELRPFVDRAYLACGSALCGGRAYALLERFFRSFTGSEQEQYAVLNDLAQKGLQMENLPQFTPTFCGTRENPMLRGSICNLGEENFTPAALSAGLLLGMARELKGMFEKMPEEKVTTLIASGNGVRKNPALVQALERVFEMPVKIPVHQEEAAFGAALFAASAAGDTALDILQKRCIHYLE